MTRNTEKGRASSRRYYHAHKAKMREGHRKWRIANPNYDRKWAGLPEPTRPEPEHCENCGRLPNGVGGLHSDHDHKTGVFRGWLCHSCNNGLGLLGDSKQSLLAMLEYLARART